MALVVSGDPHLVRADVGQQDVVRAQGLARVPEHFLRSYAVARAVVAVFGKVGGHLLAASRAALRDRSGAESLSPSAIVEHPQRVREIADQFHLGVVVLIDFGGQKIRVNDRFVAIGIPQPRMVLDHVEAQREDQIGAVDGREYAVLAAQDRSV